MNEHKYIVVTIGVALACTAGVACVGQVDLGQLHGDAGAGSPGAGTPGGGSSGGELDAIAPTETLDAIAPTETLDAMAPPIVDDRDCPILLANEELIDDMEGAQEPFIPMVHGRAGVWSDNADTTPNATLFPPIPGLFQVSDSGDACHGHVARTYGGPFLLWGSEMTVSLGAPYDASAYSGISFWAKATPSAFIGVALMDKSSFPAAGICNPAIGSANGCYDNWSLGVQLPSTWSKIVVPFSALSQGGWGNVAPHFDPTSLYGIEFTINPGAAFDISVDDVALVMP